MGDFDPVQRVVDGDMRKMGIPKLSSLIQSLVNRETLMELNRTGNRAGANNVTSQLDTPFGGRLILASSDT